MDSYQIRGIALAITVGILILRLIFMLIKRDKKEKDIEGKQQIKYANYMFFVAISYFFLRGSFFLGFGYYFYEVISKIIFLLSIVSCIYASIVMKEYILSFKKSNSYTLSSRIKVSIGLIPAILLLFSTLF